MKKIITIFVALIIALTAAFPVCAADSNVTYDGNADKFIFGAGSEYSPTDLFSNFKSVMPGDVLMQQITVKNSTSNKVKVKIYLRALGAHEGSEEFLSKLHLQVQKSTDNPMAYMFDAPANETAGLTDAVLLGTLYSGGEVNLDVTLYVDPELSNEFQNQIGYLDWEFLVEELPIEPGDPQPPKTGDNSRFGLWLTLMLCSITMFLVLVLWRKKDDEEKEKE